VRIRAERFVCFVLTLERLLRAGRFLAGWITRVGLQAERSVELDYEWGGS